MAPATRPFTDFGFKKLFGTEFNKELLIDFLNQVLADKEQIQDLTYLNTENLGNVNLTFNAGPVVMQDDKKIIL